MPNLYLTRSYLKELKKSEALTNNQRDFFGALINAPVTSACDQLSAEIKKTPYFSFSKPHTNFSYLRELNKVYSSLNAVRTHKETLLKNSKKLKKLGVDLDALYQNTADIYGGTLVLPINQTLDARLGDSRGECFGFVGLWAKKLLQNQKPFGIDPEGTPFKPIALNSVLGEKHPELNHLAILNEEVAQLQISQRDPSLLSKAMSFFSSPSSPKQSVIHKLSFITNNLDATKIALYLNALSMQDSAKVYNLNMYDFWSGHAIGFCKHKGKYHFFDSNSGWYRFDTDDNFIAWLPYYFKKMKYGSFRKFAFKSYSVSEIQEENKIENKEEKKSSKGVIVVAVIIMVIISPLILVAAILAVAHKLLWDGLFKHGYYALRDFIKQKLRPTNFPKDVPLRINILKKSVDDLTMNKPKEPQKTKAHILPRSHQTISAILDIPLDKLKNAEMRALNNPDFARFLNKKNRIKNDTVETSHSPSIARSSPR